MNSNEIRQQFIDYFKSKDHTFVRSAAVVPLEDPSLLFTNAGMNQFKDIFLNKTDAPYKRAVNAQKCIRVSGKHNDLEEVGYDTYHHTFFEMLGNWSFGDYYKKEAINWAWELLTDVWKLPKERLYVTVFGGDKKENLSADSEAEKFWHECTDINPAHILRFSKKDNFWEMGATGPCGPCSEIHMDLTDDLSGIKYVNRGTPEVIEIWNLVFIQYNRDEKGKLSPLPSKHVDTGAGFERLVAVLQNKKSNYDTDVFTPLITAIAEIAGINYKNSSQQMAFRVIADHIRMLSFSIADGGIPSNEGRGYVIRRILRRAARYGRNLNLHEPFLYRLVDAVIKNMGDAYPEIVQRSEHIKKVIRTEEENFNKTLDRGLEIFAKIEAEVKKTGKKTIPGNDVFKLYDTFGFPADLTAILASEKGLTLDMDGFNKEMAQQRNRARASAKFTSQTVNKDQWKVLLNQDDSEFQGYEVTQLQTEISGYFINKENIQVRLLKTPFYAESGGQIGDTGKITGKNFELTVTDTQKEGTVIIHYCQPLKNFNPVDFNVTAVVEENRRNKTIKNHTATHLLQAALQKVLGSHVQQQGSLVEPDRLRFDFTHFEKPDAVQMQEIEMLVNTEIQKNTILDIKLKGIDEAKGEGAMALFGEKYGDIVRTVRIGNFSYELCGGTHVRATGEIGPFIITSEEGIAAGIRRVEAMTGPKAVRYMQFSNKSMVDISRLLNSPETEVLTKLETLLAEKKNLEREIGQLKSKNLLANAENIQQSAIEKNGVKVIIHKLEECDIKSLKELGDKLRESSRQTVGILASRHEDKLAFVVFVSDDMTSRYKAGDLIKEVAYITGGGGGGKAHLATAGGKDVNKLEAALKKFESLI
jgi:alanyl-tRNA synthetase